MPLLGTGGATSYSLILSFVLPALLDRLSIQAPQSSFSVRVAPDYLATSLASGLPVMRIGIIRTLKGLSSVGTAKFWPIFTIQGAQSIYSMAWPVNTWKILRISKTQFLFGEVRINHPTAHIHKH